MENKDIYKPLIAFAQSSYDALAPLNQRTLSFFETNEMRSALSSMSKRIKETVSDSITSPTIQKAIISISNSYRDLLNTYDFDNVISDSLRTLLADLQVNTMLQLSKSTQTEMIQNLASCFANAHYGRIADSLNQAMASQIIQAPDIAFLKTSELVDIMDSELTYPRGLSSTLKSLNKTTANEIADNTELDYNTQEQKFVTAEGETDSIGLNVICSGKAILNSGTNELFTENELIDFCTFLSRTPMLAFQSEVGKKIYNFLGDLLSSGVNSMGFDKNIYYHSRSHKKDIQPFTYDQMLKAPNGLPWAGRFNQVGRSNYYFADSRSGAETEVKKHKTNDDVIQTVMLKPVKEVQLLDLSGSLARGTTFLRYLRFSLSDADDKMPREYLIPCYVSDCCKLLGFDGIKYRGSKEYSNYVVWNDGYFDYVRMCD